MLQTFLNWLSLPKNHIPVLVNDAEIAVAAAITDIWGNSAPQILCIWHINQNIMKNAKIHKFKTAECNELMQL